MNATTGARSFRNKLAAAQLRHNFRAALAPQPALVPTPGSRDPLASAAVNPAVTIGIRLLTGASEWLAAGYLRLKSIMEQRREAQRGRRLRVVETVALGEKRFLAIVQVRDQEFLISSSASGVSLLTHLPVEQISSSAAMTPDHATVASPGAPPAPLQGSR